MASSLSRRLIRTSFTLLHQNPNPSSLFRSHPLLKPFPVPKLFPSNPSPIPFPKPFSSTPTPNPNPNPDPNPNPFDGFKHQEIEGPTVERDVSALADETREILHSLRKSIYDLSSSLALLSLAHLGLGGYIAFKQPAAFDAASVQGLAAFAFPFSLAFLMRRSLKPMSFFQRMEEQGRLQILTLSLQSAKSLKVLFLRIRVVSICCLIGISGGAFGSVWWLR